MRSPRPLHVHSYFRSWSVRVRLDDPLWLKFPKNRPTNGAFCYFQVHTYYVYHLILFLKYPVAHQWWPIRKAAGNLQKPATKVFSMFRDFFNNKKDFEKNHTNIKYGNLPETSVASFPEISSRFPDNPSFTDHTVQVWTKNHVSDQNFTHKD